MRKNLRNTVAALMLLLLSGCTTFGFLFNHLDWLTSWRLSKMFDLNEQQEQYVESAAEELKPWFLNETFPQVLTTLDAAGKSWDAGAHKEALTTIDQGYESLSKDFLFKLEPYVVPFLLSLDEGNLSHFSAYMHDKKEDWFDYAKSEEAKLESRVDRIENWFGDLNDAQVAIVQSHIKLFDNEYEIRLRNSENWVQKLDEAVRNKDENVLAEWVRDPSIWWTHEYANLREANRSAMRAALFELIATCSPRQLERAREEAQEWQSTLRDVIEDYLESPAD
jgi:Family of unknown function (DUF6279)